MENTQPSSSTPRPINASPATNPFLLLPLLMQEWLTSEMATAVIIEINKTNDIFESHAGILPALITRLMVKQTPPEQFTKEIEQYLKVSPAAAQQISAEVKGRILSPIADGIKAVLGFELDAIPSAPWKASPAYVKPEEKEEPEEEIFMTPEEPAPAEAEPESMSVTSTASEFKAPREKTKPGPTVMDVRQPKPVSYAGLPAAPENRTKPVGSQKPIQPSAPKITSAPKPFMLHEEKPQAPAAETQNFKPSFSYEAPIARSAYQPETRRVGARFDSSFDDMLSKKAEPAPQTAKTQVPELPKIVHYSGLKTPLDEKGEAIAPNKDSSAQKTPPPAL